jgi:hypothetical protein
MTTFNPHDWWSASRSFLNAGTDRRRPQALNREAGHRWGMIAAFCLCFASLAPGHLFLSVLAGLLLLAGVASMGVACLQRQSPFAPHLTSWDEAAWSLTLSLGLRVWLGFPTTV